MYMSENNLTQLIKKCNGHIFRVLGPEHFSYFKNLNGIEILLFGEAHIPVADQRPHDIVSWHFVKNLIEKNSDSCVEVFMEDVFQINDKNRSRITTPDSKNNLYDLKLPDGRILYNTDVEHNLKRYLINKHIIKLIYPDKSEYIFTGKEIITENVQIFINGQLNSKVISKYCCSTKYNIDYGRDYIKEKMLTNQNYRYHRWDLDQIENLVWLYLKDGRELWGITDICVDLYFKQKISDDKLIDFILEEPLDGYNIETIKNILKLYGETQLTETIFKFKSSKSTIYKNPLDLIYEVKQIKAQFNIEVKIETFSKVDCIEFSKMFLGIIPIDVIKIKNLFKGLFIPLLNDPTPSNVRTKFQNWNFTSLELLDKIAKKTKKQIDKLSTLQNNIDIDKLIDELIESLPWDDTNLIHPLQNIRVIQTDIYAFARMFGSLNIEKQKHICDKYGQMKKIIYYGGDRHTLNIIKLINLFFDKNPDYDFTYDSMHLNKGFVDIPKRNYFGISFNQLVSGN